MKFASLIISRSIILTFSTFDMKIFLPPCLPDPPMDVRVDPGPQDGTVLVTWIPVTLNVTAQGNEKTSLVTGYAVFADGKRVTDVDSPSSKFKSMTTKVQLYSVLTH